MLKSLSFIPFLARSCKDFPAPRLARISASQDLLDTFGLSRFYDRYVRPFPNPTAPDLKGKARVKEEANAPRRMEKHLTYLTREVFGGSSLRITH